MNFLKRIFNSDERLKSRIRELEVELEKERNKNAILDDQVSLMAELNSYNRRRIDDVLGVPVHEQSGEVIG